tara:strand:+ start:2012 stop:2470 length:459 start_codon:yes stop_codon:yes gene_type:complete
MAREIPLDQIGNYMDGQIRQLVRVTTLEWEGRVKTATPVFSLDNYSQAELESMPMFFKVNGKTVPLKKALLERPTGGTLKGAWQSDTTRPYVGEVTNNMEYAEPVCYGTNLPASWKGKFKTRQGTVAGFPDLIGKELESWAQQQYQKIVRRG